MPLLSDFQIKKKFPTVADYMEEGLRDVQVIVKKDTYEAFIMKSQVKPTLNDKTEKGDERMETEGSA